MAFYLPYLHMLLPSTIRARRKDAIFLRISLFESMVSKLLHVTNFSKAVLFDLSNIYCVVKKLKHRHFFRNFASSKLNETFVWNNPQIFIVSWYIAYCYILLLYTGMILSRLKGASFKGAMVHYISKERRRSENDTWKGRWLQLQNVVLEGFVEDGAGFLDSGCLQLY